MAILKVGKEQHERAEDESSERNDCSRCCSLHDNLPLPLSLFHPTTSWLTALFIYLPSSPNTIPWESESLIGLPSLASSIRFLIVSAASRPVKFTKQPSSLFASTTVDYSKTPTSISSYYQNYPLLKLIARWHIVVVVVVAPEEMNKPCGWQNPNLPPKNRCPMKRKEMSGRVW